MKPYSKLRGAMKERDVRNEDLARLFGHSQSYASERLSGRRYSWTIEEAYAILDFLGLPQTEIFSYFPPHGGAVIKKTNERKTGYAQKRYKIAF